MGVIISIGFIVEVALGVVAANSDAKLSPGIDISDSVGESWNLAIGESVNSIVVDVVVIRCVMYRWLRKELIGAVKVNALYQSISKILWGQ